MTPPSFCSRLAFLFLTSFSLFSLPALSQVPNPPAGSTTLTRIEEASDWQTCGSCGNTGGTGARATYSMERGLTSPSLDGSSTQFNIGGPYPFKNAYWFIKRYDSPSTPVTYLKYEFQLYIPVAYANIPQAIEFECQQKANGRIYNFAWQADYAHKLWRVYNYVAHQWESSPLAFAGFSPGKWHHVIAEFHAQGSQVVHDALTIDGVRRVVNLVHSSASASSGHYLTNAFQLDLNGSATDYHVYVDAMSLTYK